MSAGIPYRLLVLDSNRWPSRGTRDMGALAGSTRCTTGSRIVLCTTSAVTADRYGADRVVSIDVLPDEVLLHVFHFYRVDTMDLANETWG